MTPIAWPDAAREQLFHRWLQGLDAGLRLRPDSLQAASADASARRYFRIAQHGGGTLIVMDAPPEAGSMQPFIDIARHMGRDCGLHVPEVLAADPENGFLLLTDLGSQPYLQALKQADGREADRLMRAAIEALVQWQCRGDASRLPVYDEAFIRRELQIFVDWCVQREFGRQWNELQQTWWERVCQTLVRALLSQPQLAMHRDYMPRNLMVCEPLPGILDFQDAVRGPIAYDIASLLRDAFISWDEERELDWAIRYWERARKAGLLDPEGLGADFGEFWRLVEWTGLQRHLKILGIFCRLKHRDGKPAYAEDLGRFFAYAVKVSTRYVELAPLTQLLQDLRGDLLTTGFDLR